MTGRLAAIVVGAAIVVSGCERGKAVERVSKVWPEVDASDEEEIRPSTNLAALRQFVWLPAGVAGCRFVDVPRTPGNVRGFGPTDYVLTAYVEITPEGWAEVGDGGLGEPRPVTLPAEMARAILPPSLWTAPAAADAGVTFEGFTITGTPIRALAGRQLHGVVRIGGGIVLSLSTT